MRLETFLLTFNELVKLYKEVFNYLYFYLFNQSVNIINSDLIYFSLKCIFNIFLFGVCVHYQRTNREECMTSWLKDIICKMYTF